MNSTSCFTFLFAVAAVAAADFSRTARAAEPPAPGATRVARWKDDKAAAFLLMFDDSCPTDVRFVVPELKKRGLTGTFYVNPGKGEWKAFQKAWEKDIPAEGMEYANHTFTHKGVKDAADAEEEIGKCNEAIARVSPGKEPRLISFGRPGVKPGAWNITDAELAKILAERHLIERPKFDPHGAAIHLKSAKDMARLLDSALAKGGMEYVIFHGVGGDWIIFPLQEFTTFLDALAAKKDQVWVTGHIAAHKYETERDGAAVRVAEATDRLIRLDLTCKADPKLYDAPLTLVTTVPAAWGRCEVVQGSNRVVVTAANGQVRFDALPGGEPIVLRPGATANE